ncbi:MAG: tRNA pseudouridine(55) synthase TruB [Ruminococcaceae bacterium]|nr:tRNA pseudouridine(55) synthase TruB [Oscillospiraceae bacterium]
MTGFICLDKPKGITSFLAVAKVRRIMGEKKCGHAGTLDPIATGVLPIMLGGATRFLEFLPTQDKAYTATMKLGIRTDTLDITGEILKERLVDVTEKEVLEVVEKYKGEIEQIPPMYSAIRQNGQKLYKLARQGIEVERKPRSVEIKKLEIEKINNEEYILYIECSMGTYIRTLIDDIGQDLGTGATMMALRRTMSSGFKIENALTIEDLERNPRIITVEEAFNIYPKVFVTPGQAYRFKNGGSLNLQKTKGCKADGLYRVYNETEFIGLGEANIEENELKFKRVFIE